MLDVAENPAATQAQFARHETEAKITGLTPAGAGGTTSVHDEPFQVSVTGVSLPGGPICPIAVHEVRLVQSTAASAVCPVLLGLGVIDHELPFQVSTKVVSVVPSKDRPTPTQNCEPAHEIPLSSARWVPLTGGAEPTVHPDPFHVSTSGCATEGWITKPTAMHQEFPMQVTPLSWVLVDPAGIVTAWIDHDVPFHCSASGVFAEPPTAMQDCTEVQLTATRADTAEGPVGELTIDQAEPFHSSVSVTNVPGEPLSPTAMQNDEVTQDTPSNSLDAAPSGLGVGTTDQPPPFQISAKVVAAGKVPC